MTAPQNAIVDGPRTGALPLSGQVTVREGWPRQRWGGSSTGDQLAGDRAKLEIPIETSRRLAAAISDTGGFDRA